MGAARARRIFEGVIMDEALQLHSWESFEATFLPDLVGATSTRKIY